MSAVAVPSRSLFESPMLMWKEPPPHAGRTMKIWRELPAPREEPVQATPLECVDEECERWDGLS